MRVEPLGPLKDVRPLVFSFDEGYARYFSVTLTSLAAHARRDLRYDIVVFGEKLAPSSMQLLQEMVPRNFTLRFFDMIDLSREALGDLSVWTSGRRWATATFFDLLVPLAMPDYERVLYCDSDLIFADDPDELFTMPFDGRQIIAAADTLRIAAALGVDKSFVGEQLEFVRNELGIDDPRGYFNAGAVAFNIPAIQQDEYLELVRQGLSLPQLFTADQDVLNLVFKDRVALAPQRFNVQTHVLRPARQAADEPMVREYLRAASSPAIVHCTAYDKPWLRQGCAFETLFWEHARQSPFYRQIAHDALHAPSVAQRIRATARQMMRGW